MAWTNGTGEGPVRRVVVIGVAGGGKSTVARALSARLGVPHVELDALFWQAGWTKAGEDEFAERVRAATDDGGWVVDGNYSANVRRITWGAADLVVWVDLPRAVVMWQLVLRTVRRTVTGVELWNGNRERPLRDQLSRDPSRSILLWAWRTYGPTKREYEAVDQAAFPRARFIRLRSRRQVRRFLRRSPFWPA
ncbi:AAA family ATPase [Kribbella lupini]|uniref:Adenylate kinase family enzyme n=1 Tax=Kribbella lupini TaxID=291602 RepID=A0ABP4KYN4_9ACTN